MELSDRNKGDSPVCADCGKQYKQRKNLYEHIRNIHKKQPVTLVTRDSIKCPVCDQPQNTRRQVFSHLYSFHDIPFEVEKRTFSGMNEFREWKESLEKNSRMEYVLERGAKRLADSSEKFYYHCAKSGYYEKNKISKSSKKQKFNETIKHRKSRGTKKIGKLCPSTIEVQNHPHKGIDVVFYSTHFCLSSNIIDFIEVSVSDEDTESITVEINDANDDETSLKNEGNDHQNEMIKKIEQLLGVCSETKFDRETCASVIENLDQCIEFLQNSKSPASTKKSATFFIEKTVKQKQKFSVESKS